MKWVNDLVLQGCKVGGILAELQSQPPTNKNKAAGFHQALVVGIAVLIITCPCALGLAVPVAQVVAAGALLRQGVMVKDAAELVAALKQKGLL